MMMISRFMISAISTSDSTPMMSSPPVAVMMSAKSPQTSLANLTSSTTMASTSPK